MYVFGLGGVGGEGGECVTGLGLGFTNPGGTGGKWDMCLWFCYGGVGGVGGEWVSGMGHCGVKSVFVVSLDYLC